MHKNSEGSQFHQSSCIDFKLPIKSVNPNSIVNKPWKNWKMKSTTPKNTIEKMRYQFFHELIRILYVIICGGRTCSTRWCWWTALCRFSLFSCLNSHSQHFYWRVCAKNCFYLAATPIKKMNLKKMNLKNDWKLKNVKPRETSWNLKILMLIESQIGVSWENRPEITKSELTLNFF